MNAYRVTFAEPQDGKPVVMIGENVGDAIWTLAGKKIASAEELGPIANWADKVVTFAPAAAAPVIDPGVFSEVLDGMMKADDNARQSINTPTAADLPQESPKGDESKPRRKKKAAVEEQAE